MEGGGARLRARVRALWLPKEGNRTDEYEDAYAYAYEAHEDGTAVACHFAVADGATEASFSRAWAQQLVVAYCAGRLGQERLAGELPALQQAWRATALAKPLPWYAEEKARSGAFAALVGLTLAAPVEGAGGGAWEALAIGDSCLFQVRAARLIMALPLTEAAAFGNRPALLASSPTGNAGLADYLHRVAGDWAPSDDFYLLTDALACWFLGQVEAGGAPWGALRDLAAPGGDRHERFAAWLASLRQARALRNDDVTLLHVSLVADDQ